MVKLKGFTITETIISLAVLSIAIAIASFISTQTLNIPNRSEIVQVSNILNDIEACQNESEFHAITTQLDQSEVQIESQIINRKDYTQITFQVLIKHDTIFNHYIILRNEI